MTGPAQPSRAFMERWADLYNLSNEVIDDAQFTASRLDEGEAPFYFAPDIPARLRRLADMLDGITAEGDER